MVYIVKKIASRYQLAAHNEPPWHSPGQDCKKIRGGSEDNSYLNVLLEKATRKLGELNAFTLIVPNTEIPDLMGDLELFLHNDAINVPHLIKR